MTSVLPPKLPRPRKPDYCTGVPDGSAAPCCKQHDLDYINRVDRKTADINFFKCLWRKGLHVRAVVYFIGVRLFGRRFYPRPK